MLARAGERQNEPVGRQEEDGKGGTNMWSPVLISVKVMARGL